jgi:hypothetical protein
MDSDWRCAVRHIATTGQRLELAAKQLRNEWIGSVGRRDDLISMGFHEENRWKIVKSGVWGDN